MVAAASVRAAQQATVVRAASASVAPQSCRTQARCYSEEAPVPGDAAPVSPKIQGLVDEIAKLTLLEVADLCATLKTDLNIADAAPMAFAAPAGAAPAGEEDAGEEEAAGPAQVAVKLVGFKSDSKVKVIKEVKAIMAPIDPKFNLAAAKRFVESLPGTLKEDVPKEEADKMKEALEAAGGEIKLE
eukprot:gene14741-698_t